jgi:thymidylate synthase (FAD)
MPEAKLNVELIAYTPNPVELCAQSAGICYDKEKKENPGEFIKRIIKTGHESVIEHAVFTFRVEGVSRALTHQLVRHRLASYSQRSQRYVKESTPSYIMPDFSYLDRPVAEELLRRSIIVRTVFTEAMNAAWNYYNVLLAQGVKPEDARFVLPNACETKFVMTVNARELRHILQLRMDKKAQWEIREMCRWMFNLVMGVARPLFDDLAGLAMS